MITAERITRTLDKLSELFLRNYRTGEQCRDLATHEAAAFGQFLDQPNSHHRGLYGTAAGLRVLAATDNQEARTAAHQIVRYLMDRLAIEQSAVPARNRDNRVTKVERDQDHVIKLGEILYALSLVKASVAETQVLVSSMASRLQDKLQDNRGWGYFLTGPATGPQLLPTAYAVRGLAAHGYDVTGPVRYIMSELESPAGRQRQTDVSVRVLCVFVLTFLGPRATREDSRLRVWLVQLWNQLAPLLDRDLEANIEYSDGEVNYYVRVPWQLYLICASSGLKALRCFSSALAQRRLTSILRAVNSEQGFFYPHSGDRISARTNSVLFDVFSIIGQEIRSKAFVLAPFQWIDRVRVLFGSKPVRIIAVLAILGVIALSVWQWSTKPAASVADLGPGFAGALMLLVLFGRKDAA
jgi:hypothetical protein